MNRGTVSSDMRRALTGRGFMASAAGMALAIALASLDGILQLASSTDPPAAGTHAELVMKALSSDWVTLALPVLCALPYTAAFVEDVKSGFIKQFLHRSSIRDYIAGKLLACAVSGGLAIFSGVLLAYALSALVITPMELTPAQGAKLPPYFASLIMKAAVLFCSGALWSLVGSAFAALTLNRFMAYASPFIIYYVLIILRERYFEALYVLYPKEWLTPSKGWVLGSWGVVIELAVLSAVAALSFALAARKRLANV